MFVSVIAAALAVLSCVLNLWQWVVARRFPLNQRAAQPGCAPPVTVLKPLKGCDSNTEACLRSWLDQRYDAPLQILFGAASAADPVCDVVERLLASRRDANASLVITSAQLGVNGKVSNLVQLYARAAHDVVIVSDSDVWAPPDLLSQVAAPLRDPSVGLVNCLYQLAAAPTTAMELEAVAVNADFWSQVLQARSLRPLDFALGAVMATTRARLKQIGGFEALLDHLADDYQLGHKIALGGASIELCPVVVECRSDAMTWRQVWKHQLRWNRTIRVCQPGPFFLSILSNATLWPLLWIVLDPGATSAAGGLAFWCVRIATARSNQRRLTGRRTPAAAFWMPLAKDLLAVALWLLAFCGNTIEWRGERFRMRRDGRLERSAPPSDGGMG